MSKEREFLKKLRYASLLENDLRKELEELLSQPESLREGLREDLREDLQEDLREGISLRDHFAGLAMQGVIAFHGCSFLNVSAAYEYADAMLAEREKK